MYTAASYCTSMEMTVGDNRRLWVKTNLNGAQNTEKVIVIVYNKHSELLSQIEL